MVEHLISIATIVKLVRKASLSLLISWPISRRFSLTLIPLIDDIYRQLEHSSDGMTNLASILSIIHAGNIELLCHRHCALLLSFCQFFHENDDVSVADAEASQSLLLDRFLTLRPENAGTEFSSVLFPELITLLRYTSSQVVADKAKRVIKQLNVPVTTAVFELEKLYQEYDQNSDKPLSKKQYQRYFRLLDLFT